MQRFKGKIKPVLN